MSAMVVVEVGSSIVVVVLGSSIDVVVLGSSIVVVVVSVSLSGSGSPCVSQATITLSSKIMLMNLKECTENMRMKSFFTFTPLR